MSLDTKAMLEAGAKLGGFRFEEKMELCHYTDLSGLMGIVENCEIWLSDHRFLNDALEHTYGEQLTIDILKEFIEEERGSKFSFLVKDALEIIKNRSPIFYVASMSLAKDKLDQWKAYGSGNENVCIVFENDFGPDAILVRGPMVEPRKVYYQRDEQLERIKVILSTFKDVYISNPPCKVSEFASNWQKTLAHTLAYQFIAFKHNEFSSEEEVRLVISTVRDEIKHRVSKGRLIPYLTTKLSVRGKERTLEDKLPIKEIIVGPIATQDSIIKSIEVFVENKGYKKVLVSRSKVPFRG